MKRFYIIIGLFAVVLRGLAQDGASNLEFVENKGQWNPRVRFKGELPNGALFLEKKGFSVIMYHPDDLAALSNEHHGIKAPGAPAGGGIAASVKGGAAGGHAGPVGQDGPAVQGTMLRAHAYRVSFADANEDVEIIPDKPLPGANNYFIGNDPSKWASNCRVFQGVTYRNLYPNVDVRYYTDKGQLKYDIIVHPGGDIGRVRMAYAGADRLTTKRGQLSIATSVGAVTEQEPKSFLSNEIGRTDIRCRYTIRNGNTVSFDVPQHDQSATLVIDPIIVFCSFTGSKVSNWGFTATPGPDGSFFAGGIVFGSAFPWNTGALQPTYGGGQIDVGILKLNSSGTAKVYATYIGGSDMEMPHSLICDGQGELIVLGRTYSGATFPQTSLTGAGGGADMFVVKLNAAGSAIIGSMRIGGRSDDCVNMRDQLRPPGDERADSLIRNYGDDSRSEVALDGQNNIMVAAASQSTDFPVTGGVFQPGYGGGHQDGVVLKIDPTCHSLVWASFLGGVGSDAGFGIKANPLTGDVYVAGATSSIDFPGVSGAVLQPGYAGGICDGFVAQISGDGSTLKRATYLGTTYGESIYGLQFDRFGYPYVMGTTNGTWPVINVKYFVSGSRQFVTKLKPDLSAIVYSTTFGTSSNAKSGNPNISPVAFLVDRCENVYVSGWGGWLIGGEADPYGLLGTAGMPVTSNATKRVSDNRDFYFIVIKKNADTLIYGTFFGENDNSGSISEHVDGGTSRYDQQGVIYQAICANCSGNVTGRYPTTPGVWSPNNGAGNQGCNLAALKIAFNYAGVAAGLRASVNGRQGDTSGCIPMDTQLQDTIRNAKQYIFNFGDGSPDTATTSYIVSHVYSNPGIYTVMMVAIDSSTCNIADTSYRHVIARTDRAAVDFTILKDPAAPCTSLDYDFTNTSVPPVGKPFGPASFIWQFGDNTAPVQTGAGPLNHSYANPGTYLVSLILDDTSYCNYPDTAVHMLRVSPIAKAQFITPSTGCAPYPASFNNTSLGGITFTWDFGDPASGANNTSNDVNPVHLYQDPGTYTVSLHEDDPSTCNKTSDTSFTITVSVRPKASFTYVPEPPVANKPIIFSNSSVGGVGYTWAFGDGDTTVTASMDTVQHLYNETDTFTVCLVTVNQFGCMDTACQPVAALINPLLDVPNAFTPGRFGQNAIVKVVGFGILRMDFRIYNRWGKLVFESDNPNVGWDGSYLGAPQPMDVYAYTLEAEFTNGSRTTKKGDITLVR